MQGGAASNLKALFKKSATLMAAACNLMVRFHRIASP